MLDRLTPLFLILSVFSLLLVGCGSLEAGLEAQPGAASQITQAPSPTVILPELSPTPAPATATFTALPASATPTPAPDPNWQVLRDATAGFGFALPCGWTAYDPGPGGPNRAWSIASYDEAYFLEHAIKGQWIGGAPPQGAFKLDLVTLEVADPSLSTGDAVRQALNSDLQEVTFTDERQLGPNNALLVDLWDPRSGESHQVYALRLAPELLLVAGGMVPDSALTDPTVQGMLASLSLSPEQPVQVPGFAPSPPLGAGTAECPR